MNVNAREYVDSNARWTTPTFIGDTSLKSLLEDLPSNCRLYLYRDPVRVVVHGLHVQSYNWGDVHR